MVRPPDQGVRVLRAGPNEDGAAWVAALAEWDRAAEVLKDDAGTTVWRARLNGRDVVVKCWSLGAGARVKSWLRASRGFRHWRGAAWLAEHGFGTAKCFALVRGRADGKSVECLVMEALQGKSVVQHLADQDLSVPQEHALARELGRMAARMNAAGGFNRDHKGSNLIVMRMRRDGGYDIGVIDCLAIGGRHPDCGRMLFNVLIEAIGVGVWPRRSIRMRALRAAVEEAVARCSREDRREAVRLIWADIRMMVDMNRAPAPRVTPLSPHPQGAWRDQ